MDLSEQTRTIIGQPEGQTLEYKAVMLPSRVMAQHIAAFANTDGGYLILGVSDANGQPEVLGLSPDFQANAILHKALDFLTPQPSVRYQYIDIRGKNIYSIQVEKSTVPILLGTQQYQRQNTAIKEINAPVLHFKRHGYTRLETINKQLEQAKTTATNAHTRLIEHYQSILKIIDDLGNQLYPQSPAVKTTNQEGKILTRILYTSIVDNFETYLSDLLYEIFLANPATLKSQQTVTVEEVLNCSDLQEFVHYWAKEKLSKLQKGSVKGFIEDNKQISALGAIDKPMQKEIDCLLQIRHLYAHRNGVVDEKFLQYFPGQLLLNSEHQMSIDEACDKLTYLADVTNKIDLAAVIKFKLAATK